MLLPRRARAETSPVGVPDQDDFSAVRRLQVNLLLQQVNRFLLSRVSCLVKEVVEISTGIILQMRYSRTRLQIHERD